MPKNNSIQIRRGSNSEWVSANPTLVSGEPAFETDTSRLKIGDGSTAWSGLNYIGSKETLNLVRNDTGSIIYAGQTLYVSGIYNNSIPSVAKYVADGSISQNLFIGLASSNISNNSNGYATSFGQIDNLNTMGAATNNLSLFGEPSWTNGTLLYAHPTSAGRLTSTRPTRAILIGSIIYAHGTQGKIFVKLDSQGLIFDNGTNVGIGTSTPTSQLHVVGTGLFSSALLVNNNIVWHSGNFDSSNIVRTTGNQIINGVKTFNQSINAVSGIDINNGDENLNYKYGDIFTVKFNDIGYLLRCNNTNNTNRGQVDINAKLVMNVPSNGLEKPFIIDPYGYTFPGDSQVSAAVTSGYWRASTIQIDKGGTGQTSYSNGQLLIGSGTSLIANTLSAGTGIAITNGSGTITINSSLINSAGDVLSTGSFIAGSGSAANPSFEFVNDTDTGLFSPAANTFGVSTSGVERLRISNNGNIGINYSAPTTTLQVNGSFSCGSSSDPSVGGQGLYIDPTTPLLRLNDSGPNYVADIDVNGLTLYDIASVPFFYTDRTNASIGIGTNSPAATLDVNGTFKSAGFKSYGIGWFGASDGSLGLGVNTNPVGTFGSSSDFVALQGFDDAISAYNPICLTTQNAPQLYLNTDGNIGIGTAAPSTKLDINGNVNIDGNLTFDSFTESVVAIGNSSTSKTISLTSGTVQTCTLTGNCTFTMPTATAGKSFTLFLNSGAGNYTATFTGVRWADSASPTATITASKVDIYSFISDGTYWYGSFSQNYG